MRHISLNVLLLRWTLLFICGIKLTYCFRHWQGQIKLADGPFYRSGTIHWSVMFWSTMIYLSRVRSLMITCMDTHFYHVQSLVIYIIYDITWVGCRIVIHVYIAINGQCTTQWHVYTGQFHVTTDTTQKNKSSYSEYLVIVLYSTHITCHGFKWNIQI